MKARKPTNETTLYALALLLALGLRMYNLGAVPLSDTEAEWALQALQVARPGMTGEAAIGPQPAYVFLSAATFALFGASNFAARFWPALAGSLLVLLPVFYRRELGRTIALIMAFGLAIDPGLAAVSRQAGGPMLGLAFGLLALGLWHAGRPLLGGITAGLALLSGPAVIGGALGLGLSWTVFRYARRAFSHVPPGAQEVEAPENQTPPPINPDLRTALFSAGATILLAGTLFFLHPQGLAAWFNTLPTYLDGWITPSGLHPLGPVAALIFYQPFALLLALVGLGRWLVQQSLGIERQPGALIFPLLWLLFSLVLVSLYPGRQISDLVWFLVPLWALAAIELNQYLPVGEASPISLAQAGLVLILAGLFWNTLIATSSVTTITGLTWTGIRAAVLFGILVLGALTTVLVSLGWSWKASRDGLFWGLTVAFTIYSIGALWGATQLRPNQPHELWSQNPGSGHAGLLAKTLEEISRWKMGFPQTMDVVSTVDAPSMRWALRDIPSARFVPTTDADDLPEVIITHQQAETPALTAAYRGQDFVWWVHPGWEGILPPDFVGWLTFRQAPLINEKVILWARTDLFPGGSLEPEIDFEEIE